MSVITPEDAEKIRRDDLRAEYSAIANYHSSLVLARFTIAGLLTGGSAFLAAAAFSVDRSPKLKALCGAFAAWLTVCSWLLELRSRTLYSNVAQRGVQIEHEQWKLVGADWYVGLFSRQYKSAPPDEGESVVLLKPGLDIPRVFGFPLSSRLAKLVSHSVAFDFLYSGAAILWVFITLFYGFKAMWP